MKEIKGKVFILTHNEFNVSECDEWNVQKYNLSHMSLVDAIAAVKSELKDFSYAIVTDANTDIESFLLKKSFLSNNIIYVSNLGCDQNSLEKNIRWILNGFATGKKMKSEEVFFVSDTHFNHANIIKYCNRPWNSGTDDNGNIIVTEADVERMNEKLIANWNSVVSKYDCVWMLGDFCLGKNQAQEIPKLVSRLNGRIHLILGNHDNHSVKFYYDAGFVKVYDKPILWNNFYILSHVPVQWIKSGLPYANLFGHVHNQEMYQSVTQNTYNCCVEVNDYKPISFSEIQKKMSNLNV